MLPKVLAEKLKFAFVGLSLACLCLNFNVFAASSSKTQVLLNVSIPPDNDIILIPQGNLTYNPPKNQSVVFGSRNMTMTVQEPRITSGTCTFRLKPYGNPDSDYATYTSRLTASSVSYSGGTCQTTLPANQQTVPRWDIEVRISGTNTGKVYGSDISYFMAYGAIGVVSLSGKPCSSSGC